MKKADILAVVFLGDMAVKINCNASTMFIWRN